MCLGTGHENKSVFPGPSLQSLFTYGIFHPGWYNNVWMAHDIPYFSQTSI